MCSSKAIRRKEGERSKREKERESCTQVGWNLIHVKEMIFEER